MDTRLRRSIALTPPSDLRDKYFIQEASGEDRQSVPDEAMRAVEEHLRNEVAILSPQVAGNVDFRVVDLPSRRVRLALRRDPVMDEDQEVYGGGKDGGRGYEAANRIEEMNLRATRDQRRVVITLDFGDTECRPRDFNAALREGLLRRRNECGADLRIGATDHWCPGAGPQRLFGDRASAERLIRATSLRAQDGDAMLPVNLVVIDEGVTESRIPDGMVFMGGLAIAGREPGASRVRHGSMVLRNAASLGRNVRLFDCPLLPERIGNLGHFLSDAVAVYEMLLTQIAAWRAEEKKAKDGKVRLNASWVIVNAWGVYDRRNDPPPDSPHNYGENPEHPLNRMMQRAQKMGIDVIFAAGNCGQFSPNPRCGPTDRGPGRSIHGTNSHPDVLTVGAVRTDGLWLGYSAEGPGQKELFRGRKSEADGSLRKPDICAPSQFSEYGDCSASGSNTGTSAACGMAAGVVVALRNRRTPRHLSPSHLRELLRRSALQRRSEWLPADGTVAELRLGNGIIDAEWVVNNLPGVPAGHDQDEHSHQMQESGVRTLIRLAWGRLTDLVGRRGYSRNG